MQTMERRASSPAETGTRRFPKFVQVWPGETPVSPQVVESPFVLAGGPLLATLFLQGEDFPRGELWRTFYCLRCNRELGPGDKSVAVYMFAQTVGVRPRQKSTSQRICFCSQCSVSLAMGPAPEGALNIAAWQMIRDLVGADPALNQAAWETLRGIVGLLPATGTDGNDRPARGGYFEF